MAHIVSDSQFPARRTQTGPAASGSQTPSGVNSRAEIQREIFEALAPLQPFLTDIDEFTIEAINQLGMSTDEFKNHIKAFTSYCHFTSNSYYQGENKVIIDGLLTEASLDKVLTSNHLNLKEFIALSKWLFSVKGRHAMLKVCRNFKLFSNPNPPELTVESAAYARALSAQMSEHTTICENIRDKFGAKIDELRSQIEKLELDCENAIASIKAVFYPAADYRPIEGEALGIESYNQFCSKAALHGHSFILSLDDGVMEIAVEQCGENVRQMHMHKYCQGEKVKDALRDFLNRKIVQSISVGDVRGAGSFFALLAAVGGVEFEPAATDGFLVAEGGGGTDWEAILMDVGSSKSGGGEKQSNHNVAIKERETDQNVSAPLPQIGEPVSVVRRIVVGSSVGPTSSPPNRVCGEQAAFETRSQCVARIQKKKGKKVARNSRN